MIKINDKIKFEFAGSNINKKQIILTHTYREANGYLASLSFRYNSKYNKIPNYFIKKDGEIFKFIEDWGYSNYYGKNEIDRNAIIISLENLGWLEYNAKSEIFINWKGEITKEAYQKKWRDYDFWDFYTDAQMESLSNLSLEICEKNGIIKNFIGHNTKDDAVSKFAGIVTRSNYNERKTDLSPAFDFKQYKKNVENE